jgi:hypothetical protein
MKYMRSTALPALFLSSPPYEGIEADRGTAQSAQALLARAPWEAGDRDRSRELVRAACPDLDGRDRHDVDGWARERGISL